MTAITNVTLKPGSGWQALTSVDTTGFLRLSKIPPHVPVYLIVASSTPTTLSGGFRWEGSCTHFYGELSGNVYARIANNSNDEVIVSVWQSQAAPSSGGGGAGPAPYVATPLGYQQITSLSTTTSVALTVPATATFAIISTEGANIRWRDDGTNPTISVGMPLYAGSAPQQFSGDLATLKLIAVAGTPTVNISYYK